MTKIHYFEYLIEYIGDIKFNSYFRYFIEYAMVFFYAFYCYIPMKNQLKIEIKKLLMITVPVLTIYSIIGAFLSAYFNLVPNVALFTSSVLFFIFYCKTLRTGVLQCLFMFFHVCSFVCYPYLFGVLFDALQDSNGSYRALSFSSLIFQYIMLLIITVVYFLLKNQLTWIIENFKSVKMWRVLWIFPCFYMVVLILIVPVNYSNLLYRGRSIALYLIIIICILLSELLITFFIYKIAYEVQQNLHLSQQNQFLEIHVHEYNALRDYMEQTKQIRHDFKQQLRTISFLLESECYDELKSYMNDYTADFYNTEHSSLCGNSAVDAIAGYYRQLADYSGIKTDWILDLPEKLPMPEPVFCSMLGNLLENAIDGCKTINNSERVIHIAAEMPSSSILVLVIENTYNGEIKKSSDNTRIISVKHERNGIGIESVKAIVEKYNGNMQINYDSKTFCVNILLNLM